MSELPPAKRVALAGFDEDVQVLVADVLESDGYHVSVVSQDVSVDDLLRIAPELLMISTGVRTDPVALLDTLRQHTETAAIPVIVLGTTESVQEQAHASGNVYASLSLPFGLEELRGAVRDALSGIPFERRVQALREREPLFAQAADVLAAAERELMLMWVQQIRLIEPFRDRSRFSTREFLDNLPRLLHALVVVLRHDSPPETLADDSNVRERARLHAASRFEARLPIDAVVREYQVLRQLIIRHLEQHLPADAVVKVLEEIDWRLDTVMRVTVAEYMHMSLQGRPPDID